MKNLTLLAALSTSIFGLTAGSAFADYTLNILHINDWHSRIEGNNKYESTCSQEEKDKGECIGGAARLITAIQQQREALNGENVLLLNGGDNFQGSLYYATYKGSAEGEFLNQMKFDAMTVGNHEFDDGEEALVPFLKQAKFPVLSANVSPNAQSQVGDLIKPSVVLEVGGEKIGIVGAVTNDTPEVASPGPNIAIKDDIASITAEVEKLKAEGVNKIIALTHVGYVRDKEMIAKIPGVDIVVGGHSHSLLSNTDEKAEGPYPTMVDNPDGYKVPVTQAASYSKFLGSFKVTFDDNGVVKEAKGDPIHLDNSIAEDEGVLKRIAELGKPIEDLKNKKVGDFTAEVDGSRETCRAEECTMGNLIADAILDRTRDQGVTIAIQNGGGIRASIDAGPVTMGEVLTVLPFQNTVATFQLSGQDLMDSLEAGLSEIEEGKGKFPQVAGIRYTFDKTVAPNEGRLKSVEMKDGEGWAALDPAKTYTIVTNNFVREGGDGYKIFAEKAQNAYDYGPSLEQVVADYISANSPYSAELDGRIKLVEADAAAPATPAAPSEATPAPAEPAATAQEAPATAEPAPSAQNDGEIVPEPATPAPSTPPGDLSAPATQDPAQQPAVETPVEEQPATEAPASDQPATDLQPTPQPEPSAQSADVASGAAQPSVSAGGTHVIAEGDTLWDLAEAAYGDGSKWRQILRANRGLQPNRLLVGSEISIPAAN